MILCLSCKRLWPRGAVHCGHCGKTLGRRLCPELHPNRLQAKVCTTCGTRKLTHGTHCLSLRLLTWALAVGLTWIAWDLVVLPLASALWEQAVNLLWLILTPLITLAVWSLVVSLFVGDKRRTLIASIWSRALSIVSRLLSAVLKLSVLLIRRSKQ